MQTPRVGDMPMLVFFQLLEFRQMLAHFRMRKSFAISAVISHRQRQKVISHDTAYIHIVMQTFEIFIMKKFMFGVSHVAYQVSGGYPLSSGRQTHNLAVTLEMSANLIF